MQDKKFPEHRDVLHSHISTLNRVRTRETPLYNKLAAHLSLFKESHPLTLLKKKPALTGRYWNTSLARRTRMFFQKT